MNTTNKADRSPLQEPLSVTSERETVDGRPLFPDLSGWLLRLYAGLMLAALAALMGPPVYRMLERLGGAL